MKKGRTGCSSRRRTTQPSAVIITTRDQIIIAIDGSITHRDGGQLTGHTKECKISKQRNVFYVVVGPYKLPSIGYDIFDITNNAIESAPDLENISHLIETAVVKKLPSIVQFIKTADPDKYQRLVQGGPVTSIALATFEVDEPVAVVIDFHVDNQGQPLKPGEAVAARMPFGQIGVAAMGNNTEIIRETAPQTWDKKFWADPVGEAERLISLEIDASNRSGKQDVGPPVSVISISRDYSGTVADHAGECKNF
jgi:hypothetical protein